MIDVIIPVCDNTNNLMHTLYSINKNPLAHIIIIDNGVNYDYSEVSNFDNSIEIIYTKSKENLAFAYETGLEQSKNPYITFINCGDIISNSNVFNHAERLFNEYKYNVLEYGVYKELENNDVLLLKRNNFELLGKFFKRTFLKLYDIHFATELVQYEDLEWNYKIQLLCNILNNNSYCVVEDFIVGIHTTKINVMDTQEYFNDNYIKHYSLAYVSIIQFLDIQYISENLRNSLIIEAFINLYFAYYAILNSTNDESMSNMKLIEFKEYFYDSLLCKVLDKLDPKMIIDTYVNSFINIAQSENPFKYALNQFPAMNPIDFIVAASKVINLSE